MDLLNLWIYTIPPNSSSLALIYLIVMYTFVIKVIETIEDSTYTEKGAEGTAY